MKFKLIFILFFLLSISINAIAQSGSFIVGIDHIQKSNRLFHYLLSDKSLGLKLGYSRTFQNDAWNIDFVGFANYMDYNFNIDTDKYFNGGTLYTGIGVMPQFCLNPNQTLRIFLAALIKRQYSFGQGDVFKKQPLESQDQTLERKFISTGFGLGFSPRLVAEYPINKGFIGAEAGWDSSDAGKGVNALRSQYYKPINYHSSFVFLGLYLKI